MCEFVKVDDLEGIKFSSRWKSSKSFNSYGRLINKDNEYVKVNYPGSTYQVVLKKERAYSTLERMFRITQGLFYSLLTLGLCNLKKDYRGLFTQDKKVLRIAVRVIHQKPVETSLETKLKSSQEEKPLDQTQNFIN